MSDPKLTPWFPASVRPVYVGVYQARFFDLSDADDRAPEYHYWNGKRWWYGSNTPRKTAEEFLRADRGEPQPTPKPWRGLASDPRRKA